MPDFFLPPGCTIVPLLGQNPENGTYSQTSDILLPSGIIESSAIQAITPCIDLGNSPRTLCGTNVALVSVHFVKPPT